MGFGGAGNGSYIPPPATVRQNQMYGSTSTTHAEDTAGHASFAQPPAQQAEKKNSAAMLDSVRPWWTLPYGHPEKTQRMEELQMDLKPRLEGFAQGFLTLGDWDLKSTAVEEGAKTLRRQLQKGKHTRIRE